MPVIYSPLSDTELDSICLSLVGQELPYFSAFHEAFVLLYLTGCRVEEIFDISRWERLSGYEMRFLPQKDNYHRNVTLDSRCNNFIDAVVGQYKPFGGLSSGQLNSLFYSFSEYSNYKVGSKAVSLYLFRYNFIRKLHADGLNINQIADKMGYTSTTVVGGYLTAEIEKGFFLDTDGFININGTWWAQRNLAWTDGGSDILVFDSFGTGELFYYYRFSAVQRYLSLNPAFSLPSNSDFALLHQFLIYSGYNGIRSLMIPSLVYWTVVLSPMVNAYNMCFMGTGRILFGSLNWLKSYACFFLSDSTPSVSSIARLEPYNISFINDTASASQYFSVRLILDI